MDVGDEARRGRADQDAGGEIADKGGNFQALGDEAEDQGDAKTGSQRGDQRNVMVHGGLGGAIETGLPAIFLSNKQAVPKIQSGAIRLTT